LTGEFDLPWFIPGVAYCISSHDIGKTLKGTEWREGGEAGIPVSDRHRAERDPSSKGSKGKDNWVCLSYIDIKVCARDETISSYAKNRMSMALALAGGESGTIGWYTTRQKSRWPG
jgi:hypothetical protein